MTDEQTRAMEVWGRALSAFHTGALGQDDQAAASVIATALAETVPAKFHEHQLALCRAVFEQDQAALAEKDAQIAALTVLLPPAAGVSDEYMEGWVDGQTYLIANQQATRAASHNARPSHASAVEVGAANGDTK